MTTAAPLVAISDTGPLISVFQSDSSDLVAGIFAALPISSTCMAELRYHGWNEAIAQTRALLLEHTLTTEESKQALEIAIRIGQYSRKMEPAAHMGEAEILVLARRPEFAGSLLLLDELAARKVASEMSLEVVGFAGILLLAVREGLADAIGLRERLLRCQQQGTHYSTAFIERVYQRAKEHRS